MKKILIAILLSTSLFLGISFNNSIKPVLAQDDVQLNFGQTAKDQDVIGTTEYNPEDGSTGFASFVGRILTIILTIAALILFVMLLWGGVEWITSGGDKSKVEKARNRISQSIIGMIVLAATIALFSLLQIAFDFKVLNFTNNTKPKSDITESNNARRNTGN